MKVQRAGSVAEFLALAGTFLEAREAEHNLIFGICSTVEADPSAFDGPPYLASVLDGDGVVGAALRTPPHRLVVSLMDQPGAIPSLVDDLEGELLPGVVGPADSSRPFAQAWSERTGLTATLIRHERGFRLRAVRPGRLAPGEMVVAEPSHRAVITEWMQAFHDEAIHDNPLQDWGRMADRWIAGLGRTMFLWVDDGRVVSMAGSGGRTPNGIRVGPVYTPPELRRRGYASALVAEVSRRRLDEGRRFVFLFTDLANPTSNRIYQEIGYEPVNDVDEFDFD